jgi:hypothetical protein
MSENYEQSLEQENVRLRADVAMWRKAAGCQHAWELQDVADALRSDLEQSRDRERLRAAEDVIGRCQKEFCARDISADILPDAVAMMLDAYRSLLVKAQGWKAELKAADAVVKAARTIEEQHHFEECSAMDDSWADGCTCYLLPLHDALAAYDALGAKEVLCEHGAGEGVECFVCHPKAVES